MLATSNIALRFAEGRSLALFALACAGGAGLVVYSYRVHLARARALRADGSAVRPRTVGLLLALRLVVVAVLVRAQQFMRGLDGGNAHAVDIKNIFVIHEVHTLYIKIQFFKRLTGRQRRDEA